jgi:hypothetical protein
MNSYKSKFKYHSMRIHVNRKLHTVYSFETPLQVASTIGKTPICDKDSGRVF